MNKEVLDALKKVEDQLKDQRGVFEKWKQENSRQEGSTDYIQYVNQFTQWEREVLIKRDGLLQTIGSAAKDEDLKKALETVRPMEFLMALMTMQMRDQSFLKALLKGLKNLTAAEQQQQQQMIAASIQAGPIVAPFNASQPPPNVLHMFNNTTPSTIGNNPAPYGYAGRTDLTMTPIVPATWTAEPAVPRSFRPPSPLKEYQQGTPLPFRDFSQS